MEDIIKQFEEDLKKLDCQEPICPDCPKPCDELIEEINEI